MGENVRDVGHGKGLVIQEYTTEQVQDLLRILRNDYSTAALIQEIDQRQGQLVESCGQIPILEQYARQLAKALDNQGATVKTLLDQHYPLTQENMRHIAERSVLQSDQATILADHVASLGNILASNLLDVGRLMEMVKALIRDHPQPPDEAN